MVDEMAVMNNISDKQQPTPSLAVPVNGRCVQLRAKAWLAAWGKAKVSVNGRIWQEISVLASWSIVGSYR